MIECICSSYSSLGVICQKSSEQKDYTEFITLFTLISGSTATGWISVHSTKKGSRTVSTATHKLQSTYKITVHWTTPTCLTNQSPCLLNKRQTYFSSCWKDILWKSSEREWLEVVSLLIHIPLLKHQLIKNCSINRTKYKWWKILGTTPGYQKVLSYCFLPF